MGRAFEKRKSTIFARMDRVGKQFAKIGKEIAIAVKAGGPSLEGNPALRRVVQNARVVNMPKDKIEAAIKKASGQGATSYDVVMYEGYAPHGIGLLVECATNNPTRTAGNVRAIFTRGGGNLGTTGSVSRLFRRMGAFRLKPEGLDAEALELELIDHGLEEMGESAGEKGEPQLLVRCAFAEFGHLQKALEDRGITPISAESEYLPIAPTPLPDAQAHEVLALVDKLEQDDDVQKVFHTLA